ncbi:alpha/beta hydrolase [Alsobacter soli]|uniref:Alpha/beta hydrolase n=1 Tax=Alsobacter soli TaxID=2109933 RepID=A0A2T1HSM1_9HYPH|nr:alpha/beta hydrolase [Alsobacter soli]PSC04642.1 alpha/beta hydrolase [Alsobacter soli]
MSDLADLFPGFASKWIDTEAGKIFARVGGEGPPLMLLHGFPQTHVMWRRLAPALAERFTVVAMDLRGYGWSTAPRGDGGLEVYSKRAMGRDVVAVMEQLGHVRFALVGHDRGARVGYRLALDEPGRVERLALLDIMPTLLMWERMDAKRAMQVYHWTFLAQPEPLPEKVIGGDPIHWLEHTLASWTKAKSLAPFDAGALAHYRAFFNNPDRIHACCEDYRAGATTDLAQDRADRDAGKTIACPTAVIWGSAGIPAAGSSPLDTWHETFAPQATGQAVDSGHFVAEENPQSTLDALLPFLTA